MIFTIAMVVGSIGWIWMALNTLKRILDEELEEEARRPRRRNRRGFGGRWR